MSYKLLGVDLDGTLLQRDGSIHAADLAAIRGLQAAGIPVTIITGRLYSGSRAAAVAAAVRGPVACADGSHIVDARDDTELFSRPITGADALAVRAVLERLGAASFLFQHDGIVHDEAGAPFASYVRTWSPNVDVVERATSHPCWEHERGLVAVAAIGPEAQICAAAAEVRAASGGSAFVIAFPVLRLPGTHALLIRAAGVTKGTAVTWLAAHHGCSVGEVVVVGDWLNDVPMFEVAGRSFAMGQAPADVKRAATDHLEADALAGGGVAEAIRRAWGPS